MLFLPRYFNFFLILTTLFATIAATAQSRVLEGTISDTLLSPLQSANILAIPQQSNAQLKFAISDHKGRYRLELQKDISYEVTASYLGYLEQLFIFEAIATVNNHNFKLSPSGIELNEIVIKHDFKQIIVKKDTLIYNIKSFANGNERKMKEILEKLPGVEVDKNGGVIVQGKRVTQLLVEGKPFFGGGSKLAVENIPADALDKIEVIDHFNEVGFMKQVSDSDELAMNVKLKEDKKKFIFGDIDAAVGNEEHYLAHAGLFYYRTKSNFSLIANANTFGRSMLTFDDVRRFDGGVSNFIKGRKSLSNLYEYTNDNKDAIRNKSQFAAFNFSVDASDKMVVSGYGIFSKIFLQSRVETFDQYLLDNSSNFESRTQNNDRNSHLGMGNIKLSYASKKDEIWYYNLQFQLGNNEVSENLQSVTQNNTNLFETIRNADDQSLKQYLEWHRKYNANHTATFVVNHAFEQQTPSNFWSANQNFLNGLIPLQESEEYKIRQLKKFKNNNIDAMFKHYWVINNYNHVYTSAGNNFDTQIFQSEERQILDDGTINNFDSAGFGNNVDYRLNDAYLGVEYKFRIQRWTNKPGIYLHNYSLVTMQNDGEVSDSKWIVQPQWDSEYEFNNAEKLSFLYRYMASFPDAPKLSRRLTLDSYNVVSRGNALLGNERYHNASLRYTKMNMYRGIQWNAFVTFNKKSAAIRNDVVLEGINQLTMPFLYDSPETNWRFNGSVSKKIYRFTARLTSSFSGFNYVQTINNISVRNNTSNQDIGLSLQTSYKKWPFVRLNYTKGFSQLSGLGEITYQSDAFNADFDWNIYKSWSAGASFESLRNTNSNNQKSYFDTASASVVYHTKSSPFTFELSANNIFNTQTKNSYTFSDFIISERFIYIMPRVVLLSISYKL